MAKRQVVSYSYTCDVCGTEIPEADGDGATRKVSWEGTDYVVDVCTVHGSALGDVLTKLKGFVDAGSRSSGRRGRRPSAVAATAAPKAPRGRRASASSAGSGPKRGDLGAIRSWARDSGQKVSERGRIPAALLAAYDAAHSASAPAPAASAAAPAKKAAPARAARKRGPRKKAAPAASEG
jgi:hypothetical protein